MRRTKNIRIVDYTGRTYGLLYVEQFVRWKGNRQIYLCKDIFGNRTLRSSADFCKKGFGNTLRHKDSIRQRRLLNNVYFNMLYRCYDPNNLGYKYYGARGIVVCEEWLGAKGCHTFIAWAVTNANWQEYLWLDRIDNNGNYSPTNCRFITAAANNSNRRTTKLTKELVTSIRADFSTSSLTKTEYCKLKAEDLGVSSEHLENVLRGNTWKEC